MRLHFLPLQGQSSSSGCVNSSHSAVKQKQLRWAIIEVLVAARNIILMKFRGDLFFLNVCVSDLLISWPHVCLQGIVILFWYIDLTFPWSCIGIALSDASWQELYGFSNINTGEWTDGLVEHLRLLKLQWKCLWTNPWIQSIQYDTVLEQLPNDVFFFQSIFNDFQLPCSEPYPPGN